MTPDWIVLHAGALGDLVLTIQLALRLPRLGNHDRLRLVSRGNPGDLSQCRPSLTRQSADGLGLHWLYANLDESPPAALLTLLCGAQVLNALGDTSSLIHRRLKTLEPAELFSFDPRPRTGLDRHITEQWQADLEAQYLQFAEDTQPTLTVADTLRQQGREMLHAIGSPADCVFIHPGSGGREKCWPLVNFLTLARSLTKHGAKVCFLLGPTELEWWNQVDLRTLQSEFSAFCQPAPDVLASILTAGRLLIANDSGPTHLAALLGTPTIAIFGPTSATIWQPLGRKAHVIVGDPQSHPDHWGISPQQLALFIINGHLTC